MENLIKNNRKSTSLPNCLSIRTENEDKLNIDKAMLIDEKEDEITVLREKYNKQCFNKKMAGYYIDLYNFQRNCQEAITRSTNVIQTFFPKKLSIPFSKHLSRHLSQRNMKSRSNGLRIVFSNKNKSNIDNISINNDNTIQNQLKLTPPMLNNQNQTITRNPLITGINKNNYITQSSIDTKLPSHSTLKRNILINKEERAENRRKIYKVSYDINWIKREGFYASKDPKNINRDYSYQKQIITYELIVLLDNISNFRVFHMAKLLSVAMNINPIFLAKLNIILEETCSLIMEIVHLILKDFTNYLSVLSNNKNVYPSTQLKEKIVKNEYIELKVNIDTFIELSDFLKSANEMYIEISSQLNRFVLPSDNMTLVKHYLSRCRYNVSKLIFTSNSYFYNSSFDEDQYGKYRYEIKKIENNTIREYNDNVNDIECYKKQLKDTNERIKERLMPKPNYLTERVKQLNLLLNKYTNINNVMLI